MNKRQLLNIIKYIVIVVIVLCTGTLLRTKFNAKSEPINSEETSVAIEEETTTELEAESIEIPEETVEDVTGSARQKKGELTQEKAEAIIMEIDDAMYDIMDSIENVDASETKGREEIYSLVGEYFDEPIIDYALFVYQIQEENGKYTHIPYAEYSNYWINTSGDISILSQGNDWCEIGVTFHHAWRMKMDEEIVPVRLEWKEEKWLITDMSQWFNDFRYYYEPDESFDPEYFTKEQAEKLIENFGTDEMGRRVPITVSTDKNGCILAGSSEHLLSENEINGLSKYECYLAVQEIYARHGKKFSDPVLYGYFMCKDWYEPYELVFSMEKLSEIETKNIEMLAEKEQLTWETDINYGNLYPFLNSQEDMITEEEAAYMLYHAFNMADEVISFKNENLIAERSDEVFHVYSLGDYLDEDKLKKYLSNWFDEQTFDYLVMMYSTWNGLYKGEDGKYTISEGGTYAGNAYYLYPFQKVTIKTMDENTIIIEAPFCNMGDFSEKDKGIITFSRFDDRWIITAISQPSYDEFYKKIYRNAP